MKRAARLLSPLSIALALGVPRTAWAEDQQAEIAALEAQIAREAAALSTESCEIACRALGSMERARGRLCALDPGPKCADARDRVKKAVDRVRAACPDCGLSLEEAPPAVGAKKSAPPPEPAPAAPPPPPPAPAPEAASVRRSGGCAGCTVADDDRGGLGAGALAVVGALVSLARRRRRAPPAPPPRSRSC
jgi:MYXO-CTERM domain-containing protein